MKDLVKATKNGDLDAFKIKFNADTCQGVRLHTFTVPK